MGAVSTDTLTPAQVLERARAWYARQMLLLEQCHGDSWSRHCDWCSAYLREELRQRLIARGWRAKGG
jgi:hypothetical protein